MSQASKAGGGLAPSLAPIGASAALAGAAAAGSRRSDGGGYENYYNPNASATYPRSAPSESQATSAGFAGRGAGGNYYDDAAAASAFPVAHPTGTSSSGVTSPTTTATTAASRKAREAQQERLRAHNDVPESSRGAAAAAGTGAGFSTPASPTSDGAPTNSVVVHSDGGRYVENPDEDDEGTQEAPEELPPQYHSIPAERR